MSRVGFHGGGMCINGGVGDLQVKNRNMWKWWFNRMWQTTVAQTCGTI